MQYEKGRDYQYAPAASGLSSRAAQGGQPQGGRASQEGVIAGGAARPEEGRRTEAAQYHQGTDEDTGEPVREADIRICRIRFRRRADSRLAQAEGEDQLRCQTQGAL